MKKRTLKPLSLVPKQNEDRAKAQNFYNEIAVDTLARTLWGEARGEGSAGMQAVAQVILNRMKISKKLGGYWWGNDIVQICQKPFQFSCWNKDDPNRAKLIQLSAENDIYFVTAIRIARRAVADVLGEDVTGGATHYHAASISSPYWVKDNKPTAVLGRHIFYRLVNV